MPFALFLALIGFSLSVHAAETPLASEHSSDVILYLWWALGILGSFSVTVSSGTGVWILLRVLRHDNEIAVIKARCALHEDTEDDK